MNRWHRAAALALMLVLTACGPRRINLDLPGFAPSGSFNERIRVLDLYPGVTATIVAPANVDTRERVDLILYALPNGNSTAQTIGRKLAEGVDWHYDIQHIGAQTRALRTLGLPQAIVVYLEADTKSWPQWRQVRGYDKANARIVEIVDQIRMAIGNPPHLSVTLTGHSGGGSFMFGFIEGQDSLPSWLERIAFLDANYNFDYRHGEKLVKWLRGNPKNTLVVIAYDDRNIMLDGKKVVSDSGGTWRASERMMNYLREPFEFTSDTLGQFRRFHSSQIEVLLHPNPENKILHTVMIGEMNAYMHAMLVRRPSYDRGEMLLKSARAYTQWVEDTVALPAATPPDIPPRAPHAMTGSAFIKSVTRLSREEREAAIRRELFAGNIPSFLRKLSTVEVTDTTTDSVKHTLSYEVMPDYLAIGSDRDFVRMPMTPYTAQAFCDAFGFVLPTRKMVNDIWVAAKTHLDPRPLTVERESPLTFLQHNRIIEDQLKGVERGTFVAGIKKDVVVTNRLGEKPQRVAIYGWHYVNGQPIQPLYVGHVDWYVDYSHGIRPVRRAMRVDGVERSFDKIITDPQLSGLISDEGVITVSRYDK
ncbi:MAG TPA: hypothetical protein VD758_03950 [Gemmatimonadaceae bacterium]|nr:hypothetical protein [Gemmatimonadaceae bacterium]